MSHPASDIELLIEAGKQAGEIAISYFGPQSKSENKVQNKPGGSPVSEADFKVDNFLREKLLSARPEYGWLSEETEDNSDRMKQKSVFVVDPIDGTRGFLSGRKEWCISIAIVTDNKPIAGVLECPALGQTFHAAFKQGAHLNLKPLPQLVNDKLKTVTASGKLNDLMSELYPEQLDVFPFIPSLAYRIAMVAEGRLDAAFARKGAHDWDLAAAQIILEEAGGILTNLNGQPRMYNQDSTSAGPLLISGKNNHQALMELAKSGGFLH